MTLYMALLLGVSVAASTGRTVKTTRVFNGITEVMSLTCKEPTEILCLRFIRVGVCCPASQGSLKSTDDGGCIYLGPKPSTLVSLVKSCTTSGLVTSPIKAPYCTFLIGKDELTPVPNERIIDTKTCAQAPGQNPSTSVTDNRFYVEYDCISGGDLTTCDAFQPKEGVVYLLLSVAVGIGLTIVVALLGACTRNMMKPKKE